MTPTNSGQRWQGISPDRSGGDPATTGDSGGPITNDHTSIDDDADVSRPPGRWSRP